MLLCTRKDLGNTHSLSLETLLVNSTQSTDYQVGLDMSRSGQTAHVSSPSLYVSITSQFSAVLLTAHVLSPSPHVDDGLVTKSCPTLATPWTVACQAPLSRGFTRQEYWVSCHFLLQMLYLGTPKWIENFVLLNCSMNESLLKKYICWQKQAILGRNKTLKNQSSVNLQLGILHVIRKIFQLCLRKF